MLSDFVRSAIVLTVISSVSPALAADCSALLDQFNRAIDAGLEAEAQLQVDRIATSAECGRYQVPTQIRLSALRLASVQGMMARGRPASDFDRLLVAAESPEVLWQASATMGEVRFGERRFAEAAQAYDRAIEIIKNETLTPVAPSKFEIESLFDRSAQSRLLAANISATPAPGGGAAESAGPKFVKTARDQRDGTLGGLYSRSVRGIVPRAVPVPITFDYAKTSFTDIGNEAARELASAMREQHPSRITLIGHTDVRGSADTNLKLSRARADAVAAFLKENGIEIPIVTEGRGANDPMRLSDTSGLSQDDIYALNRRVEWRRE
jgi:outer membrane protein OmpA-like peptidoglycan-associated protein